MDLAINRRFHPPSVVQAECVGGVKAEESCESRLAKPRKLVLVGLQITPDRLLYDLQGLDSIDSKGVASATFTQALNPIRTGPFVDPPPPWYADLDKHELI